MTLTKPILYDLFCGAGGAARGYANAGFEVVGVDLAPQPRYPYRFIQADALEFIAAVMRGEYPMPNAWHASPPCQGYSIMNNLPWLRHKTYPLLILPTLELLKRTGKPYVLENVMGARHGAKGLAKRGLEAHGLKAGWLCGGMFGLLLYRHLLFAANWLWLAPEHPKHQVRIRAGHSLAGRARDFVYAANSGDGIGSGPEWRTRDSRGEKAWPGRREQDAGLTLRPGYEHVPFAMPTLSNWQNRAQANGVGIGHARGWRLAAEAMGIDWMNRKELTQLSRPLTHFMWGHSYDHWYDDAPLLGLARCHASPRGY